MLSVKLNILKNHVYIFKRHCLKKSLFLDDINHRHA